MAYAKELMGTGMAALQAKTLGGLYSATAAAGSTQTDATAVGASNSIVTAADGTKGVRLLAGEVGDEVTLFNNSASTLKVYPPSGAAIAVPATGLGSADASYAHTTYAACTYKCLTATQWLVTKSA
jgi:hypothetical protein